MSRKKEGRNVLINDALNTFCLQLYGVKHMVNDHSDRERRYLLPSLHGLFFSINNKRYIICTIAHKHDSTYHSLCFTSHGELGETKNSPMGPPWGIDQMTHCTIMLYNGVTSHSSYNQVQHNSIFSANVLSI